MKHPLINQQVGKHYGDYKSNDIFEIEKELTVAEMIGACKFNILKYASRQDKKGQKESDLKKIKTYQDYLELLQSIDVKLRHCSVAYALNESGITFK